jgi:hypothetical protein
MEKSSLYYYNLCKQLTEAIELLEKKAMDKKKKIANKKKLDQVGKEDKDVNNDGKVDSSDEYLMKRRNAIAKNMKSKKKMIKEGTIISDGKIYYGGFPRLLNENNGQGEVEAFRDDNLGDVATRRGDANPHAGKSFDELSRLVSETGRIRNELHGIESSAYVRKKKELGLDFFDNTLPFVKSEELQRAEKDAADAYDAYKAHPEYQRIQQNLDPDFIMGRDPRTHRARGDWTGD